MVGTVHTDSDNECRAWPVHRTKPTTTLLQHSEKAALLSQTKAINAFHAAEAAKLPDTRHASNAGADQTTPSTSLNSPLGDTAPSDSSLAALEKGKRTRVEEVLDDESGGEECEDVRTNPRPKRLCKLAALVDDLVDNDGILIDVDVQPIADTAPIREGKTADLDAFFGMMFDHAGTNGKVKKHRKCKICLKQCILVNESTTLCHHAEANFAGKYRQWAKKHSFESMLPGDIKARKEKAEQAQQTINSHLTERKLAERVIPYSDKLFKQAAIKWLVATDQPIQALDHPKFQDMIDVASWATNGVKIPNRRATRAEIMRIFKNHLTRLRTMLNSAAVSGAINITCDVWQATNINGYFAVTGHWIEEKSTMQWESETALLSFTQLNNAHNGKRLGGALFKVLDRVGIVHKLGHVTCDNAANNGTMLEEFARLYETRFKKKFPWCERRINCLTHVINLGTQVLISTYSKAPHYEPHNPHAHEPDTTMHHERDEIGLIRSICVKERSSAKRKELYKMVQVKAGISRCKE